MDINGYIDRGKILFGSSLVVLGDVRKVMLFRRVSEGLRWIEETG